MSLARMLGCLLLALLAPGVANAYIGPGVGLSAIGSVLAFIGSILLLLVGFIWYPIKRILKRFRKEDVAESPESHGKQE